MHRGGRVNRLRQHPLTAEARSTASYQLRLHRSQLSVQVVRMDTESTSTIAGHSTNRPPPEIIRILPPDGTVHSPRLVRNFCLSFGAVALIAISFGASLLTTVHRLAYVLFLLAGIFAFVTILMAFICRHQNRTFAAQRRTFFERLGANAPAFDRADSDHLSALWTRVSKPPTLEQITHVLARRDSTSAAARIVCMGLVEVPEVGEAHFEPEVITPTGFIGYRLIFVPIAIAIIGLWVLQLAGIIPGRAINLGSFGYLIAMGVAAGVSWIWRAVIRPTYLRMAPGIIQVLEFRLGRSKPVIRSYPLTAGTLAVVHGGVRKAKPFVYSLKLARGDQKDDLPLQHMNDRARCTEMAWKALRSTAPTPPLPDDALVG